MHPPMPRSSSQISGFRSSPVFGVVGVSFFGVSVEDVVGFVGLVGFVGFSGVGVVSGCFFGTWQGSNLWPSA